MGDEGTQTPSTPNLQGVKGDQQKSFLLLLKQQHAHHPSFLNLSSLAPSCVKFTAGGWIFGPEVAPWRCELNTSSSPAVQGEAYRMGAAPRVRGVESQWVLCDSRSGFGDDDDFPVHWLNTYFPGFISF